LDSRFEPGHVTPPAVSDGYALIEANGAWDDHDPRNVVPLVDDLASRLDTNGVRSGASALGTDAAALLPALQTYLAGKGLTTRFSATWAVSPTLEQMSAWVRRGDGVVLHMSFWEDQGDGVWVYVGGHYVTLAGLDPVNRMLAISDPYGDAFESGEATLGRSPVMHPFLHMADVHNDARYVSQDAYHVVEVAGSGGVLALDGYPFGRAFIDQNLASEFEAERGPYGGGPLQARLSYAWSLSRHQLYLPLIFKRVR